MNDLTNRLNKFFDYLKLNNSELAKSLNVSPSVITKLRQGNLNPFSYLSQFYKLGLNINWLIAGRGEMLYGKYKIVNLDIENKNDYTLKKLCEINDENQYKLFKDITGYYEDVEKAIETTLKSNPDEDVSFYIDSVNNYEKRLKQNNLTISLYSLVYNKGNNDDIYNKHLKNNILLCVNTNTLIDLQSQQFAIRLRDMKIGVIKYLNEPIGKLPTKIRSFHNDMNDLNKVENEVLNLNEFDLICGSMNRRIEF